MEVVYPRCVGLDIGKKFAQVHLRDQAATGRRVQTQTWKCLSFTRNILELRDRLVAEKIDAVVMESTSDYWKPFYYVLEGAGFEVILANAEQVKNVPGRKSDVSDAAWLAELCAHGLVRASFVPPPPVRALREATRARQELMGDRTRVLSRLEKSLEAPGIKLSVVLSGMDLVSVKRMLKAMIDGETDPTKIAQHAHVSIRTKKYRELIDALTGRFDRNNAQMAQFHLKRLAEADAAIADLDKIIEELITPFLGTVTLLCSIPGIGMTLACSIIGEIGDDMSVFPDGAHLASWAGVAPGNHESAGRRKKAPARHGNSHIKRALTMAANSISQQPGTYLGHRYRQQLATIRSAKKTKVATANYLCHLIHAMIRNGHMYDERGPVPRHPRQVERACQQALRTLADNGYDITELRKNP